MLDVRVVLADDHPIMRSGLRQILASADGIQVVGAAGTGDDALRLVRSTQPDVLVLDMEMPGLTGIEVTKIVVADNPDTRILALTAHDSSPYVDGMLQLGASGFITKDKPPTMVVEAVQAVARGEGRWFVAPPGKRDELPISEREASVLRLMAEGLSNGEIGDQLFISEHTVRNHITNVYSKIGVTSWRKAVAWAYKSGLVTQAAA
ncbi:MAG: response regulator transcription factor [Bacteroidota bacterium]